MNQNKKSSIVNDIFGIKYLNEKSLFFDINLCINKQKYETLLWNIWSYKSGK